MRNSLIIKTLQFSLLYIERLVINYSIFWKLRPFSGIRPFIMYYFQKMENFQNLETLLVSTKWNYSIIEKISKIWKMVLIRKKVQ